MYPMYDVPSVGPWIDVLVSALAVGIRVSGSTVLGRLAEELWKKANRGFPHRAVVNASVFCGLLAIAVQLTSPSQLATGVRLLTLVELSRLGFAVYVMFFVGAVRSLAIADIIVLVFGVSAFVNLCDIVIISVNS